MPEISRFYGIIIRIFYDDHSPPHFHAFYGKKEGLYSIEKAEKLAGEIPAKQDKIIKKWARQYRKELLDSWNMAKDKTPPKKVPPAK